jgi:hypothetical protein
MFGLEKKKRTPFEFDLEKQLKSDKKMRDDLIKVVDARSTDLKKLLREGSATEDFDKYGMLLHAYAALTRVINRLAKKH